MGPEAGGSGAPEAATGVVTIGSSSTTEGQTRVSTIYVPDGGNISLAGKKKNSSAGTRRRRPGGQARVRWPVLPPAIALCIPNADGSTPGRPGRLPLRCFGPRGNRSVRPSREKQTSPTYRFSTGITNFSAVCVGENP